jgi:hypothetical protein
MPKEEAAYRKPEARVHYRSSVQEAEEEEEGVE